MENACLHCPWQGTKNHLEQDADSQHQRHADCTQSGFRLFDEGSRGPGAGAVWLERKGKLPYLVGGLEDRTAARVAGSLAIFGLEEIICLHNKV